FDISQTDQLSLAVPDFYQSNVPDNSFQSAYKTSYFSRSRLGSGQTYFPYNDVVKVEGIKRVPNYPASIEVRYLKKARSGADATLCYFREEYEGTTLRRSDEIADRAADERVQIRVINTEQFQISSSFASRWTGEAAREGTRQFSTVSIQNFRTDK
ncbi:MAG TPA: hypothetical protein VFG14_01895, partial [Chthoniobacteraceae bacterium]|nr:hypothetical protein [Chthoniobacteraceae bacterium]